MRATYKSDNTVVPVEITRNLKAKFENWKVDEERENHKNINFETVRYTPTIDTAKNLKAKFEAIRFDSVKSDAEKPKFRVNRFTVSSQVSRAREWSNLRRASQRTS